MVGSLDPEASFKEYREALRRECAYFSEIVFLIEYIQKRASDRQKEFNLAPAFFNLTVDSLWVCIFIWAAKLFSSAEQRGIPDFIKFISENISIFTKEALLKRIGEPSSKAWFNRHEPPTSATIAVDQRRLDELSPIIKRVKHWRDKYYAHFDKRHFIRPFDISFDAPVPWDEIIQLKDFAEEIFNTYSVAFDGSSYSLAVVNVDDLGRILDLLHSAKIQEVRNP